MSQHLSVSNEGVALIKRWDVARKNLERLRGQIASAECELANSQNELGKWMVPDVPDAMEEQFNIWISNGLLSAKKIGQNDYQVKWRKPPSEGALSL